MTDEVRAAARIGTRRWTLARAVVVAGLVLVTATGCGLLPGLPGSPAAPVGGSDSADAGTDGAEDGAGEDGGGAGSSPTEPFPLGQPFTVKSGFDADVEWEITITGMDGELYTELDFTEDKPCVAVLGTATLVQAKEGESEASGLIQSPGMFLLDKDGQNFETSACVSDGDTGYRSSLDLSGKVGETIKFADTYAGKPADAGVLELQDAISLADGGGADKVYAAVR